MNIDDFLKDKKIVILGFGKQGKSCFNYLRNHFPNKKIIISDKNTKIDIDNIDENVELKLGDDYLKNIDQYDLIIKSPGVILKDENILNYKEKIITDYELLLNYTNCLKIGITGTKGKSTTSIVLYNVLKEQGKKVFLLGNIGNPIFDFIDNITDDSYCVIEVSSHTLEYVKCSPDIGILLNIYPEHLDHVNNLNEYINAKFNIAKNMNKDFVFIYNAENKLINEYNFQYKENDIGIYFNSQNYNDIKNKVYLKNNSIYFNNEFLMNADEPLKIKGNHMLNNMMFILAASQILGLDLKKTVQTIKNTEPLEHRMEYVGKYNGIFFYNDSIATIPIATINCIKTLRKC